MYSIEFYLALAGIAIVYYLWPRKSRWIILLAGSGLQYWLMLHSKWQLVLFALHLFAGYLCSQKLRVNAQNGKKTTPALPVLVSLLPLVLTRFVQTAEILQNSAILPIGLSFYSLQMFAYFMDIREGKTEGQSNPFKFALFFSFFPQIIQGPIPRYNELGNQLEEGHSFKWSSVLSCFQMTLWGLFLKFMIADKAALYVNTVLDRIEMYSGIFVVLALVLYGLQLYTDFLSCVVLSKGMAALFGIQLPDNFRQPYFSRSIRELWRRWHMTLSAWLRDYVYIPLGGSRHGKAVKYRNLILTFLVSGLWHGCTVPFVLWGLLQAFYQIIGELTLPLRAKLKTILGLQGRLAGTILSILITDALYIFSLIFFRMSTLEDAVIVIRSLFQGGNIWVLFNGSLFSAVSIDPREFLVLFFSSVLLLFHSLLEEKRSDVNIIVAQQPRLLRWIVYASLILSIWIFGTYGYGYDAQSFIYGQF